MKHLAKLLGCIIILAVLAGCQNIAGNNAEKAVDVFVEGGGQFPEFLVGQWKEERTGWEFVFESDGSISSAVHTIGRVKLKPGQTTEVPMIENGKGVFEPDLWIVQYFPERNELLVEITLKHFRAQKGEQIVEGSSRDIFIGPIAKDKQQWTTEWFAFPEYIVSTDTYDNYALPVDYDENPQTTLIFEKVKPESID